MRRSFYRRKPLHSSWIRKPEGADVAAGPGLRGSPLDRVVAVLPLLEIGIIVAIGVKAAPDILYQDGVSALDGIPDRPLVPGVAFVLVVRRPEDQRRKRAVRHGSVEVSPERHCIAHRNFNVGLLVEGEAAEGCLCFS